MRDVRIGALVLAAALAPAGCAETDLERALAGVGPRGAFVASTLASADEPLLRTRPQLVAGKYARMASAPFEYFRGSVPVYRADARAGTSKVSVTRFGLPTPLVPTLGDAHPENFGVLRAADGSLALEPNDLDAADRAPYLWDVRRLVTGMALAASLANADDPAAREASKAARRPVARAAAEAYRDAILRAARGEPLPRVDQEMPGVILGDLFRRSLRDEHAELATLTVTADKGTKRRLVRGAPDATDPEHVLLDLPPFARDALHDALARYAASLRSPRDPRELEVLDAARELGTGVASWPRVRVLVLVRGPTDAPEDDEILELKELADAQTAVAVPPFVHADDVGARVLEAARGAWAREDAEPRWGVTRWLGFPCQVRRESEGQKTIRVARMVGERGTPRALGELARTLGTVVARVHTTDRRAPEAGLARARAIWQRLAEDPEGFADEQADVGVAYTDSVLSDHAAFVRALVALGPRLGLPVAPEDAPRADLALLYAAPPTVDAP